MLLLAAVCAASLAAAPGDVARAEQLYQKTRYAEALRAVLPEAARNPEAMFLAGKAYYMTGDFKKASEMLEKAVAARPKQSAYRHWLGRAWGRRAETSFPLVAPRYAGKARDCFEKAVELDPHNGEALNDLMSYYLQAPGFLGGGLDKAEALLGKIKAHDPAEYEYALAQLAQARKDFHKAEQHLKRAAELAPKSVGRLIDVARFVAGRGRIQEGFQWLARAEKVDAASPELLFEKARLRVEAHQDLEAARQMLERYLERELNPDLPSRREAEKLLKQAGG
jgi:tetratricopeptide (TPR) repeat protein